MKLISNNLSEIDEDGSIIFELKGFVYNIGELDGISWFSRKTVDDYENGTGNWKKPSDWVDENRKPPYKFLKINLDI